MKAHDNSLHDIIPLYLSFLPRTQYTLIYYHSDTYTLQLQLYLVLVSHVAASPHLFHHQVPQISLRF